jgi:LacI family transcriptional regulator
MMGLRRRATLLDVAGRAGVSTTTASYILNGRSGQMRISPVTQERVRRAALDLGYRPNRSARNLRTATTATIGVISDFVASGHFASHMLSGASAAARDADHLLLIGETEGDPEVRSRVIEEMLDRQVDAIVYTTVVTAQVSVPEALLGHRVALLNCVDPAVPLPAVLPDERGGGRAAAELLLRHGVEGEVFVVGEDPTPGALSGVLRLEGLRAALAEVGRELSGVIPCPWDVVPAYDAVAAWLSEGHRPAALVCLNDRIAMGVYQALDAHGLAIPGDVSVVSFDGSELAGWMRPVLSTVMVPYAAMGELAVRLVMDPTVGTATPVLDLTMPVVEGRSVRGGPPDDSAIDGGAG